MPESKDLIADKYNFFADMAQIQLKTSTLEKIVVLYGNIAYGKTEATEELKTALRSSIKELCKNICNFIDREQAAK